jgi:chromatin segregation and condensation protein Rec8/ScpA/Scc1 (kleisin family)
MVSIRHLRRSLGSATVNKLIQAGNDKYLDPSWTDVWTRYNKPRHKASKKVLQAKRLEVAYNRKHDVLANYDIEDEILTVLDKLELGEQISQAEVFRRMKPPMGLHQRVRIAIGMIMRQHNLIN